jgi:alkylation response protein AidB-like acyl-CoA dehydrogenase
MAYTAPVDDIVHALTRIASFDRLVATGAFGDVDLATLRAILDESARFSNEQLEPLCKAGDRTPARLEAGKVTTSPGWKDAYVKWARGGWGALTGSHDFGGQGLPLSLAMAAQEMWNGASVAFCLGPTLTAGAIEAIAAHGSEDLKALYLPRLISGEWMGTMNLTEPGAGSDVGALRTRAERRDDGTYRLFGSKIFITYGEHDLTNNIAHLVLARLPDAPAGTRGISLFLVPKYLVNPDGSLGARNDVVCAGLEHKLGIHGSPTCTMVYGEREGAVGWLIGEENRGLAAMFTMMNNARLAVGIQGVGIAEAATQTALLYARDRRQGRAPGATGQGMSPIIEHPDVTRMLLTGRALTVASRALCVLTAEAIDLSHALKGDDAARWAERAALLTPLAKAFSTDCGFDVASLGVQVHGGMGYIEETGAAQYLRDARITQIYEGTNGIQAIDLVSRKLPQSGGATLAALLDEARAIARDVAVEPDLSIAGRRIDGATEDAARAAAWFAALGRDPGDAQAVAVPFLRLLSLALAGAHVMKGALAARHHRDPDAGRHLAIARFLAEHLLDETASLAVRVTEGAAIVAVARDGLE